MDILAFTWEAMAGGLYYDGVKSILSKSYDKLKVLFDNNKQKEFNSHLEIVFDANDEIKIKLEELMKNTDIDDSFKKIIDSEITVNGDNKKVTNSFKDIEKSTINI